MCLVFVSARLALDAYNSPEALHVMNQRGITALFVVDAAGEPVGILHVHDLLRAGVA